MGYYTDFSLSHDSDINDEEIADNLTKISGYKLDHDLELYQAKWYSWNNDMSSLSKMFPDVLFTLNGVGEEHGDIWRAFFKNGKSQMSKAVLMYEPYDESKLK